MKPLAPRGGVRHRGRKVISREDRVKSRKQLGNLRDLVVSSAVRKRYERALQRFFRFESINGENFSSCDMALDGGVSSFIQCLWQEGEPRYWGEDVISAFIKRIPQLRGSFPGAWQLISAWQKNELPQRCTPFNILVLKAMCGVAISRGLTSMALCMAVGFHGILRTAEIYLLTVKDFPFHPSMCTCVLSLPFTKSGTRFNTVESVVLDDEAIIRRLAEYFRGMPPDALVFDGGSRKFRTLFDEFVNTLLLPRNLLYKPYSIRRGAATEFFLATGSLSRTAVRGRWQNEKTCRIYVNESMSELGEIKHSLRCRDRLAHFAKIADRFFG